MIAAMLAGGAVGITAWILWRVARGNVCACARHRIPAAWERVPAGSRIHERHRCYPDREEL